MEKFTLEQIKKAFWGTFHSTGENWFNYLGTAEENNDSTEDHWRNFCKELNREWGENVLK